jgi:TonB-linked SusC/RagA family outer membrane protein
MQISTFCLPRYPNTRLKKLFLVMKLTTLIILIGFLHVSASTFGQHLNFTAKNISIDKLFKELKKQSGYSFIYKSEALKDLPNVNAEINGATMDEVMQQVLKDKPLDYLIIDKNVVIRRKPEPVITVQKAAPIIYVGVVLDDVKKPLPGVTVKVKGSSTGVTITNERGEFTILVPIEGSTLQFSFVGYEPLELPLSGLKNPLTIRMKVRNNDLDQVQVIAYGSTTKRFNVGDQTTVSAKEIAKYPVNNVLEALQANVPGMNIVKTTGMPGGAYTVKIRGKNGLSTGTDPLYIIDGVPYQGGSYSVQNTSISNIPGQNGQGGDALNFINPQDIESINVLKDADATAIYGSRAANGVILITTKKGKVGATKVDVNVYSGISKVTRLPQFLNTQQYLEMRHEAIKNDGKALFGTNYDIDGTWDTTRYTNWAKELIGGLGHTTNAQASISGGNANTQFLISGNYNRQSNLQELGGSNQTASIHFNINSATSNNKFSIAFSGGYLYNKNTIPNVDLTNTVSLPPDAPAVYNPDGTLNFQNNTFNNPYTDKYRINSTPAGNLTSSAVLSYKPLKGWEIKATLGYNRQEINEFLGTPSTANTPFSLITTGSSNFTTDINSTWSIEPQINYNTHISKGQLTALVGASLLEQTSESTEFTVTGYTSDALLRDISAGSTIATPVYGYDKSKFSALFSRITYNWEDKYLLNVSGRYDGSSKFGPDRQYHFFGAVGTGWIFTEEKFIKDNFKFINFGKLRASYGVTGNDQIGSYKYLSTYNSVGNNTNPYQGIPSLTATNLPNPALSWESTRKAEAGLELQFLSGRISIEASYYRNRSSDLLISYPLSFVTGFKNITSNSPAIVQNKGWEFTLNTVNVKSKNFSWSSTTLLTIPRNSLVSYPDLQNSSYANTYIIGLPITIQKAYHFAGVNPQTGLYQFYDKSGKIVATPVQNVDNTAIINIDPQYFGSLQNSFGYKGFTLDFTLRFIKQTGKNAFAQGTGLPGGFGALNITTDQLARWQKPGDITNIQRFGTSFNLVTPIANAYMSNAAYSDASYIRFQNLSFGYQFPQSVSRTLHVQNLRVYVQGDNLFTISKYGNLDPENQSAYSLPILKTITTGLQVTL